MLQRLGGIPCDQSKPRSREVQHTERWCGFEHVDQVRTYGCHNEMIPVDQAIAKSQVSLS